MIHLSSFMGFLTKGCKGQIYYDFEPKSGEFKKAQFEPGYLPYQVQILKKFLRYLMENIEQIEENAELWLVDRKDDEREDEL